MISKYQVTGMRGVYLVAAELSRNGFIVSPTSRSAIGADLLVTDQECKRSFSVQVKTNAKGSSYWLVGAKAKEIQSKTHIYVLVSIQDSKRKCEFFVVPSRIIKKRTHIYKSKNAKWYCIDIDDVKNYRDKWGIFGRPQ